LDVHKVEVVAGIRLVTLGKASHKVCRFRDDDARADRAGGVARSGAMHACGRRRASTGSRSGTCWRAPSRRSWRTRPTSTGVHGRKSNVNDATSIADLLAHGLIRGSFVPPQPIQELRDLTRTRKQLGRESVQHTQRIQAVLEEADVKLSSAISDILGPSGRRILKAIVAGETDPVRLSQLGSPRLATTRSQHSDALHGRIRDHHRFLIDQPLNTIKRPEATIAAFDARIEAASRPFATPSSDRRDRHRHERVPDGDRSTRVKKGAPG
jgi:hypothetical protein